MKVYLVGGAVRDRLLGISYTEKDWVVVGATKDQMLSMGFTKVGKDFPVFLHPETKEEYALARIERKAGVGYTGFKCFFDKNVTLEEDLKRRDLTINAMAQDESGNIIDPYGGKSDLKNKIIRHVSDSFVEDPLRILRVARFAAKLYSRGFFIASETKQLLMTMVRDGELIALMPERVWMELYKALQGDRPDLFFITLRKMGALAILFKEIDDLFGVPNPKKWHPEIDTGLHFLMALKEVAKLTHDPKVSFAVMCHDFGKASTRPSLWPEHHGHDQKGVNIVKNFCKKYNVSNEFRELAVIVAKEHMLVHKYLELTAKRKLKFLENIDAFRRPIRLEQVLIACQADRLATNPKLKDNDFIKYWQACFKEAQSVDVKKIQNKGFKGKEFGLELHRQRINKIKKMDKCIKDP
jgi:tRNA nucleotidyltransferase (CCA-adding enzyme)